MHLMAIVVVIGVLGAQAQDGIQRPCNTPGKFACGIE
ncbi:hypothetical protein JX266_014407, partial [Neoarthrinium moseri]